MLKVLVTNDDGIHAPGLAVAEKIAAELAAEVLVVAPEQDCSGLSQGITMHQPLRLRECGDNRFALSGTPADCVLFASAYFYQDTAPRSEEHTSELQSRGHLVCRLLLEKKK